jgi:CRISPR-associated endonuclease Cas3-HD
MNEQERFTDPQTLWSHPPSDDDGPTLIPAHLERVHDNAARIVDSTRTTNTGTSFADLCEIVAWTHDYAKLTEWFQADFPERDAHLDKSKKYTYHAFLGAVLAMHAAEVRDLPQYDQALAFFAVVDHHQNLADVPADTRQYANDQTAVENRIDRLVEQADNIEKRVPEVARTIVGRATKETSDLDSLSRYLKQREFTYTLTEFKDSARPAFYGDLLYLWGTLKLADRVAAADPDGEWSHMLQREQPDARRIVDSTPEVGSENQIETQLDRLRTRAQNLITERVVGIDRQTNGFVGALWLPTGFGKTYTGLRSALSIANRRDGSVIYALPYTSIIDQTAMVVEDVLDMEVNTPRFLVDHYLSETAVGPNQPDTPDDDGFSSEAYLLGSAWQAGLVLTTFVQLFESMAGPAGKQAPKLPALRNAVIVLDEPQTLPHNWWPLAARLAEVLVEQFDATILLLSATQPRIVESFSDRLEVYRLGQEIDVLSSSRSTVDIESACQSFLAEHPRVEYRLHNSIDAWVNGRAGRRTLTHDDAAATAVEAIAESQEAASGLCISNTIRSARALDKAVNDRLADGAIHLNEVLDSEITKTGERPCAESLLDQAADQMDERETNLVQAHLTTRLCPADRRTLIRSISKSHPVWNESSLLLTATQLVEAGVDLSFDCVYRDIAPLPSIVQAGGRCNREFSSTEPASVTIWRLGASDLEDSAVVPSNIYAEPDLLSPTQSVLSHRETPLSEVEVVTDAVEIYYDQLHQYSPGDQSLPGYVDVTRSEKLRSQSLIDERPDLVEVFVGRTESEMTDVKQLSRRIARSESPKRPILDRLTFVRFSGPRLSGPPYPDGVTVESLNGEDMMFVLDGIESTAYDSRYGYIENPD